MTTETQAEFAARIGRARSRVTRLKQAGRLVMAGNLVDVEASLARIEATRGQRFDVEARLQRERAAAAPPEAAAPAADDVPPDPTDTDSIGLQTRLAQMRSAQIKAEREALELAEQKGELVRWRAVERALADAAAVILSHGEAIPDRLAPQLVQLDEVEPIRARLRDEMESFFAGVSAAMDPQQDRAQGGGVRRIEW